MQIVSIAFLLDIILRIICTILIVYSRGSFIQVSEARYLVSHDNHDLLKYVYVHIKLVLT